MSETISTAAAIFCAFIILLVIPMSFIRINAQIIQKVQEMEEFGELDRLSFEGERNKPISDNFYIDYEIYE